MRTTIDIDDDLLTAVQELASRHGCTIGQAVSSLLRHSLTSGNSPLARTQARMLRRVAGFEPFAAKSCVVATNEQVNLLRDTEGV